METGSEYMVKLKVEIEQEAAHVFATQLRAKEKIKTCLTDLLEISKQFKSHLQVQLWSSSNAVLNPSLTYTLW
jgi:hypothetical protein